MVFLLQEGCQRCRSLKVSFLTSSKPFFTTSSGFNDLCNHHQHIDFFICNQALATAFRLFSLLLTISFHERHVCFDGHNRSCTYISAFTAITQDNLIPPNVVQLNGEPHPLHSHQHTARTCRRTNSWVNRSLLPC